MSQGPQTLPSESGIPSDEQITTNNWNALKSLMERSPLQPANVPFFFDESPPAFMPAIFAAHAAGCTSALGTYVAPTSPEPTATPVLYAYFYQGFQHTLAQKLQHSPATHTTVNQAPATVAPKTSKIRDPDLFDGTDRAKLNTYKSQTKNKILGNASEFPDEPTKVRYAVSYLSGAAYKWAEPQVNSTGTWIWGTLDEFFTTLDTAYNDPDQARTAEWEIERLKQGKHSCSLHYANFTSLASKIPDWTDGIKKSKFYAGLNDDLKDALVGQTSDTMTFDAYVKKCVVLDRELEQRRLEKTGRRA